MPAISVVIPVYNGESFIAAAVESVLRQTIAPHEILVIDDGSTDRTAEEAARFSSPLIRVIRKEHTGLARSRNTALRESAGDYVAFLDADDRFRETYIEEVANTIRRSDPDMVYTGYILNDDSRMSENVSLLGARDARELLRVLLTYGNIVSISGTTVRARLLHALGGFCETLSVNCGCEDWDMWIRMAGTGTFGFIRKVLVEKRFNPSGPYSREPVAYRNDMRFVVERGLAAGVVVGPTADRARANLYYLWGNNEWQRGRRLAALGFLLSGCVRFPLLLLWMLQRPAIKRRLTRESTGMSGVVGTVAVAQRVLPHYRTSFFRRLDQHWGGRLEVLHGTPRKGEQVKEDITGAEFRRKRIKGAYLGSLLLQPHALWALCSSGYGVVIAEFSVSIIANVLVCWTRSALGRTFLWWGSGYDPLSQRHSWIAWLKGIMMKSLVRHANAIITYSDAGKQYYLHLGGDPQKIFIAPNSIDTEEILALGHRLKEEAEWKAPFLAAHGLGEKGLILFVGRLDAEKHVDRAIRVQRIVLDRLPESTLVIVGDGPERRKLEALAADLKVRAKFVGALYDKQEIGKWFAAASVFLLPGRGGLAINEAMCYGLPVVCVQADGTERSLVKNGVNGFRVENGNVTELADAIVRLLEDDLLRKTMGRSSITIIGQENGVAGMVQGFDAAVRYARARAKYAV